MIGHHDNWVRTNKRLKFYLAASAIVGGLFGFLSNIKTENCEGYPFFQYIVSVAKESAVWVIPICGGIVVLVQMFEKIYGPPEIWTVVHHILDEMHEAIFPPDCNRAEHRVTLFCVKTFHLTWPWRAWPPWGCWLVPVERSYHLARKSKACFGVKDDGQADGVAGQVYVLKTCVHIENLPNISPGAEKVVKNTGFNLKRLFYRFFWKRRYLNEEQLKIVELYAERTWTSQNRIIRQKVAKKSMPRAICGLPVEVSGNIWGVIVIDSRNEKLVGKAEISEFYSENAAILSKLLQHIK